MCGETRGGGKEVLFFFYLSRYHVHLGFSWVYDFYLRERPDLIFLLIFFFEI